MAPASRDTVPPAALGGGDSPNPAVSAAHLLSRRDFVRLGAAGALMAAFPAACGGAQGGSSAKLNLGLSIPFLTTPFFVVMETFTRQDVNKLGAKMVQPTNANQDAGRQITDVHTLIDTGANGILAGVVDNKAIIPALNYADQKKVPFIIFDDAPAGGHVYVVVRADNESMGEQAAAQMGKLLNGKGKVLSLLGDQSTTNGRDRTNGFNRYLKAHFPGIQIVEKPTKWQTPMAADAAETSLIANPDITGIYMQSDSVMLAAVTQVLQRHGKLAPIGQPGHISLVSIDGTPEALDAIRQHQLDASISQPLDLYALWGIKYLIQAVQGKQVQEGKTDHGSRIVKYQGNLMDLLPSPLVTIDNVNDSHLWGNDPSAKR